MEDSIVTSSDIYYVEADLKMVMERCRQFFTIPDDQVNQLLLVIRDIVDDNPLLELDYDDVAQEVEEFRGSIKSFAIQIWKRLKHLTTKANSITYHEVVDIARPFIRQKITAIRNERDRLNDIFQEYQIKTQIKDG